MKEDNTLEVLLGKKLTGDISVDEQALLSSLLSKNNDKQSYDKAEELFVSAGDLTLKHKFDHQKGFDTFLKNIESQSEAKVISFSNQYKWLWVAASLVLMTSIVYLWVTFASTNTDQKISHLNTGSDVMTIQLVEGTTIVLNKNASLSYDKDFPKNGRNVILSGEAFFEVSRDTLNPFRVYANHSLTTVLGTSFNIDSDPNITRISVESGVVTFEEQTKKSAKLLLKKGESAMLKNAVAKRINHSLNSLGWINNRLVFKDTPVRTVALDLMKYFDIRVSLGNDDLGNCLFTSQFNEPTLQEVLEELRETVGLSYTLVDDKVSLSGSVCQ